MRRIVILLSILVGLGFLILLLNNPGEDRFTVEPEPFFPKLNEKDAFSIDINHFIVGIHLEKKSDGQWTVQSRETELQKKTGQPVASSPAVPANPDNVQRVIQSLSRLEKEEPISTNPEKKASFQIHEAGLKVEVKDRSGKSLASLLVGKNGPNFLTTYVSKPGKKEVYLVNDNLPALLNRPMEEWKKEETSPPVPVEEKKPERNSKKKK